MEDVYGSALAEAEEVEIAAMVLKRAPILDEPVSSTCIPLPRTDPKTQLTIYVPERGKAFIGKRFFGGYKSRDFSNGAAAANFEGDLLSALHTGGAPVPKVYSTTENLITMQFLGTARPGSEVETDTLESRLRSLPSRRYTDKVKDLLEEGLEKLSVLHRVGRRSQDVYTIVEALEEKSLDDRMRRYLVKINNGSPDPVSFSDVSVVTEQLGNDTRVQPIHSNVKSGHIFYSEGEDIKFIDFGNARLGSPLFDEACLLFSPDIRLDSDSLMKIYRKIKGTKEGHLRERNVMYWGILQSIRRGAHIKWVKKNWPDVFKTYEEKHPEYTDPEIYESRARELISNLNRSAAKKSPRVSSKLEKLDTAIEILFSKIQVA